MVHPYVFLKFIEKSCKWAKELYDEHSSHFTKHNSGNLGASNSDVGHFGDFEKLGENPFVLQSSDDTCAIKSQQLIMERFGINVSEEELVAEAESNGWYSPGLGTRPEDVGKLLETHGIDVNRFENSNIFTIQNELAQGHQIIASVDSRELWDGIDLKEGADHALIVSHLNVSDPQNPMITLKDPGTGYVEEYSWFDFQDAWQDGGCELFCTKEAPSVEFAPDMKGFDYEVGHVVDFEGFSYSDFLLAHSADFSQPEIEEFMNFSASEPENLELSHSDFAMDSVDLGEEYTPFENDDFGDSDGFGSSTDIV